jgi:hypothetical protein
MNDFSTARHAGRNLRAIAFSEQISVDGRKAAKAVATTGGRYDPAL